MKSIYLENEKATSSLGKKIGEVLFPGAILCLNGDLGAGKTALTKSIALGLDIKDDITIVNEYEEGRLKLNHFDVYRIGSSDEMYDIGFEEYIGSEGVCIIEWSQIIEDVLPDERLDINIKYEDEGRRLEFIPRGQAYERLVEEVTRG